MLLRGLASALRWRGRLWLSRLRRYFGPPPLPEHASGRVLVHLGCGLVDLPGFINVDASPLSHTHYIRDVRDLKILASESVDLVYACHVLEHIPYTETVPVLREWWRVLRPGGRLRLSVPDFDELLRIYEANNRNLDSIIGPLLGGRIDKYDVHQAAFTQSSLAASLRRAGFGVVGPWHNDELIPDGVDWSSRPISTPAGDFPVSLNLEARRV